LSKAFRFGNPLIGGFGLSALISVAPIVSVMIVGLLVRQRQRKPVRL
jgi:hypothetical protein